MFGTIIGDIAGSYYEVHNIKTKKFKFMDKKNSSFTDDTVATLAIAKSLLECEGNYEHLKEYTINNLVKIGRNHSQCGFGADFFKWIIKDDHKPYNSYGNGAAMRVGVCGIVANSIEQAKMFAKIVTEISHNHPEAMKATECISVVVYMAKNGVSKEEIKKCINDNYYDINFTLDEIRDKYDFNITCQGSVPQALEAFLESKSFEDAIRNAISIGGDSDTIAAITGVIAGVYYGIPRNFIKKAMNFFDVNYDLDLMEIINNFEEKYPTKLILFNFNLFNR